MNFDDLSDLEDVEPEQSDDELDDSIGTQELSSLRFYYLIYVVKA